MVHAVGLGFRYRTPVGPIRLDLAYSINSPRFMGLKAHMINSWIRISPGYNSWSSGSAGFNSTSR